MKRLTVPSFRARKKSLGAPPLVVLTAYDAATTAAAEAGGVDALLVGDSLGMVVLGYESTLPVTLEDVLHHACAVGRTRKRALLIADMPWLSYHLSPEDAVRNAARFVREAGADAVKIEGGRNRLPVLHALRNAEIPVMGHLGLTPQSVLRFGGYRVQGRSEEAAKELLDDARALEEAGAFSLVLEGMPVAVAAAITEAVGIPTIGIGAGPECDGQVLVVHDLLGMLPGGVPRFVRRYDDSHARQAEAVRRWAEDVRGGRFPSENEVYG
ncbi:MAG TPA: 3-methyl-2-oxobutanoate hydroxymethyltransferase [Candidatus Polarisedimenticolaceae bacterium]|nr:3-methyl-2-oxobutanoate hydroxymethyltransferase [Candidatus Polarisedimenticolaceae bacterium]